MRSAIVLIGKLCVLALVAWGIHSTVSAALASLEQQHWSPAMLRPGWLLMAGCCGALSMLPPGLFWHRLLVALGQPAQRGETLRAYCIGHLGKYAPGKALVIVLRAGLLRSGGTTATAATVAVFYETFCMMAVGVVLAIAIVALRFPRHWGLLLLAAGLLAAVGIPAIPRVFRRLVRYLGVRRLDVGTADRLNQLEADLLVRGIVPLGLGWLLQGAGLWATVAAGNEVSTLAWPDQVLVCTAAMSLAVVAGFLSFVPGGLVVREGMLLELLTPWFGEAEALVAAVLIRLVGMAGELVVAGVLWPLGRRPRASDGDEIADRPPGL